MEVSQFTYFQQVAGFECAPVSGELTYGLERLAMYVQGVENVYDLNFNGREGDRKVTYGDVFLQAEQEYSRHNFEYADTEMLFRAFRGCRGRVPQVLADGEPKAGANDNRHLMALPAYDQCIKASHVFNLLDARGVISVTERQSYILRVRELAKACGAAWLRPRAAAWLSVMKAAVNPPPRRRVGGESAGVGPSRRSSQLRGSTPLAALDGSPHRGDCAAHPTLARSGRSSSARGG